MDLITCENVAIVFLDLQEEIGKSNRTIAPTVWSGVRARLRTSRRCTRYRSSRPPYRPAARSYAACSKHCRICQCGCERRRLPSPTHWPLLSSALRRSASSTAIVSMRVALGQ